MLNWLTGQKCVLIEIAVPNTENTEMILSLQQLHPKV